MTTVFRKKRHRTANFGGMTDRWAFEYQGSSFSGLLTTIGVAPTASQHHGTVPEHVHGTTIIALTFTDGVIIAGDRRATAGHLISKRDMRKIYQTDRHSAVGISGSAGPAIEMARIFATELEHYEKVEGSALSLEGKANKLASMVRGHLGMAMQGLVVIPLFAGFDVRAGSGRIFDFDVAGGRYEERRFSATGSGSLHAKASLKAHWLPGLSEDDAVSVAISALWDAADEDAATGGPDTVRGLYPILAVITSKGYREVPETTVAELAASVITENRERLRSSDSTAASDPAVDR